MTAQELKRSILQLAMQGGLVAPILGEDAHNDYPELFDVKSKRDYSSDDEEIPYDIPDRWIWARLKDIATNQNGYAFKPSDWKQSGLRIIRIQNLTDNAATCNYCDSKEEYDRFTISDGDVLVSWSCTIDAFIYHGEKAILNQHIFRVDFDKVEIDKTFYVYAIKSLLFYINSKRHGATMTHITKKDFEALLFPVPPLAEQRRIVAKIEELKPLVEEYGNVEERLTTLNAGFPDKLRKSILQQAIQGKLTERYPADEPASELLKRIRAEKEQLTKAGKIKKEKPVPPITEEEMPFEIPDGWTWASIGETCANIQYGTSEKSSSKGRIAVLRMGNLQNGRIDYSNLVYSSNEYDIERCHLDYNDLLFNRTNSKELVGKTAIYKAEIPAIYAGYLIRITPVVLNADFLNYVMQSQHFKDYCLAVKTDAIGQSNINAEKLKRFVFPLPPLAEQQRIVDRVNELLAVCDELK